MQDKPTKELDKMLSSMKPADIGEYFRDNSKYMADEKKAFYYFFKDTVESKKIFLSDVYSFAGVNEKWGGKIIRMEKHTKNRDLIIRFCIAGHFSLEEMNRALKLYKMQPLYAKDKRDAVMIVSINNRIYDLSTIDDILERQGMPKLSIIE